MVQEIVIVSAARTPMGGFQGELSSVPAPKLGAEAIKAVIAKSGVKSEDIDEVLLGNVLNAGIGQAPARQAALGADLPESIPCTTVSKVCGSGMKSIMLAFDQIKAETIESAIVGGMESMSLAPYFLPKARGGQRLGHGEVLDHMFYDGLQNPYDGQLMGCFAENNSQADGISREEMDNYAIESLKRAQAAIEAGHFDAEIAPVTISSRRGDHTVEIDEQPGKANPDKIPTLRPAFSKDGGVTAANASSISDGAAALLVMSREKAEKLGLKPLAVIKAHSSHAQTPSEFTHAPVGAIKKVLDKSGWSLADVDLFEVNEAFAMVTLAAMNALEIPHDKVNIHGGATALGHPIGASGARIVVTLLHALQRVGKSKGLATLCIGGGEAVALTVEMV